MSESLTFALRHRYDPSKPGIQLPVVITVGDASIRTEAKVDTGASLCVFQREHGEALGLEIESGDLVTIGTATGTFETFRHDVTLITLGIELSVPIHFARHGFGRNILGRRGWIELLRLGIVDYDGLLYVSRYDDPS